MYNNSFVDVYLGLGVNLGVQVISDMSADCNVAVNPGGGRGPSTPPSPQALRAESNQCEPLARRAFAINCVSESAGISKAQ